MDRTQKEKIARDLQAILLLGRALARLDAETKVHASLTYSELLTLQYIYLLNKVQVPVSASDMAEILRIDIARVSQILKKLEESEYSTRRYTSPHRTLLELTEGGEKIAKRAVEYDTKDLLNIVELVQDDKALKFLEGFLKDTRGNIEKAVKDWIEERKKRHDSDKKL